MSSRSWHSKSARLLMNRFGLADATAAMVQAAGALLRQAEVDSLPVELPMLASFQGVREIQSVGMVHAGRLFPQGSGFVIQVNSAHPQGKQNFTACHEVGHALLLECAHQRRLVEDLVTGAYPDNREEEYLCDVAAAELLMPRSLFHPLAQDLGFSLNTVVELSRRFCTSREATARRLVETNLWPSALALWHWGYKPSEELLVGAPRLPGFEMAGPEKKLRLRYSVSSTEFGQHLYPHLRAEPDGHLMRCFSDGVSVQGTERLTFDKGPRNFHIMAVPREYTVEGERVRDVLSLLLADEAPSELSFQPDLSLSAGQWFE